MTRPPPRSPLFPNRPLFRSEPIHVGQELVEGLLALVVRAEPAGTAAAPDGVDLIDEDDRWSMLAGVGEKTSHPGRSEEHTSELQSQSNLVCRLLLEKHK